MSDLKSKLHDLIDGTNDQVLLENIYQALKHQRSTRRDILDELSPNQLNELNESMEQYRSGKTKSHDEILDLLRQWRTK